MTHPMTDSDEGDDICVLCHKSWEDHDDYTCEGQFCGFCYRGEDHESWECDV